MLAVALFVIVVARSGPKDDPTRFGPKRTITLRPFSVIDLGDRRRLVGGGETNFPDGVQLDVVLSTVEALLTVPVACRSGSFDIALEHTGIVTNGRYTIRAKFALDRQTREVATSIHYQPKSLEAESSLVLANSTTGDVERSALRSLIDRANNAKDVEELVGYGKEAARLEASLWISTLLPGARRLSTSIARQVRERRVDFERLRTELVEAEVLSGL